MSRIDTHHHMIPPDYQKALRDAGGLQDYPALDADTRAGIDRTNALTLFPRFAEPAGAP